MFWFHSSFLTSVWSFRTLCLFYIHSFIHSFHMIWALPCDRSWTGKDGWDMVPVSHCLVKLVELESLVLILPSGVTVLTQLWSCLVLLRNIQELLMTCGVKISLLCTYIENWLSGDCLFRLHLFQVDLLFLSHSLGKLDEYRTSFCHPLSLVVPSSPPNPSSLH